MFTQNNWSQSTCYEPMKTQDTQVTVTHKYLLVLPLASKVKDTVTASDDLSWLCSSPTPSSCRSYT